MTNGATLGRAEATLSRTYDPDALAKESVVKAKSASSLICRCYYLRLIKSKRLNILFKGVNYYGTPLNKKN